MDTPPGHTWLLPWLMPLAIIAIVVCAAVLPTWAAIAAGVVLLIAGVPFALRLSMAGRGGIELPHWLPGGRPGDR